MILYGTKIISDITFNIKLPNKQEYIYTIYLSSKIPKNFKKKLKYSSYLYSTYNHKIYLYSNQNITKNFYKYQLFCYEIKNYCRFYWYHGTNNVYYEFLNNSSHKLNFLFIHPFLPMFLNIEEYFVLLHGSAVDIQNKSILFLAPYKSGKSTLTNYIAKQSDNKLITDDILPTFIYNDKVLYSPSHPYSNIQKESQTLGIYMKEYKQTFGCIDIIYILQREQNNTGDITITPLKGLKKFELIRKNSLLYTLKSLRLQHEKHLSFILQHIDCFLIEYPWGKEYLPKLYETIKTHIDKTISQ